VNGVAAGDDAGTSVAGIGDINKDGFDDFIIEHRMPTAAQGPRMSCSAKRPGYRHRSSFRASTERTVSN
jgi:hypothetical protein